MLCFGSLPLSLTHTHTHTQGKESRCFLLPGALTLILPLLRVSFITLECDYLSPQPDSKAFEGRDHVLVITASSMPTIVPSKG